MILHKLGYEGTNHDGFYKLVELVGLTPLPLYHHTAKRRHSFTAPFFEEFLSSLGISEYEIIDGDKYGMIQYVTIVLKSDEDIVKIKLLTQPRPLDPYLPHYNLTEKDFI